MRVLLKNNGGYAGMEFVQFPVEVEATRKYAGCHSVTMDELVRIGADPCFFDDTETWQFVIGVHSEEIK